MTTTLAIWEDEENNRQIQFSIQYVIEGGAVKIKAVIPEKVTFVCPETNTCIRSLQVWTPTGRRMLANFFRRSSAFVQLQYAIAGPNGDFSQSDVSVRQEICTV